MSQQEYYYKGIYPVEIVLENSNPKDHKDIKIKVKKRFLLTSNYPDESHWVKPGEVLKVPAKHVWQHRRNVAQGRL